MTLLLLLLLTPYCLLLTAAIATATATAAVAICGEMVTLSILGAKRRDDYRFEEKSSALTMMQIRH
jgi:hypothetical protein